MQGLPKQMFGSIEIHATNSCMAANKLESGAAGVALGNGVGGDQAQLLERITHSVTAGAI